jgi:adenosylmethionine-8-amino-7-oxononanoate aminotransferase
VFDPLRFPVLRAPSFSDPRAPSIAAKMVYEHAATLAAVVVEPLVQGAAGVLVAQREEFGALRKACETTGVLLVCDEVATGFGRTGTWFASEQCNLRPDILCVGKGITGGYLPMSATIANDRVYGAFLGPDLSERTLYHGHSYGGNALAAAVALRHLQLMDEWKVVENVRARAAQIDHLLRRYVVPHRAVKEIRNVGLMIAVELADGAAESRLARRTCAAAVRKGVLLRSLGPNILIVPPLTTTASEIELIVHTLCAALNEVCT